MAGGSRGKILSPRHKKEAVIQARQNQKLSERKSCKILGFNRKLLRYVRRKKDDENDLRSDTIRLATKYKSMGYRKITALLCDGGWSVNRKRVLRILNEEGLTKPKRQKKPTRGYSNDGSCAKVKALYANHVWAYDFVHKELDDGSKARVLTIIDEATRKCLKLPIRKEFKSWHIIDILSNLFISEGTPEFIRSDNGSEFTSKSVQKFLTRVGVKPLYIKPASPWQNGINERFNGTLRYEGLKGEIFYSLKEAQIMLDKFQKYYNTERPHSSLGYRVPCPEGLLKYA